MMVIFVIFRLYMMLVWRLLLPNFLMFQNEKKRVERCSGEFWVKTVFGLQVWIQNINQCRDNWVETRMFKDRKLLKIVNFAKIVNLVYCLLELVSSWVHWNEQQNHSLVSFHIINQSPVTSHFSSGGNEVLEWWIGSFPGFLQSQRFSTRCPLQIGERRSSCNFQSDELLLRMADEQITA